MPVQPKGPQVMCSARDDKLPRATRDDKLPEVTRGARDDKLPRTNSIARDDRLPRTVRLRKAGRGTPHKQPQRGTEVTRSRTTEESLGSEGSKLPHPEWPPDFPEVLKPLVLDTPVASKEQHQTLVDLLYKEREAFSLHGELGFTTAVTHRIPTGDAAPIRQAPRRLPLFAAEEADKNMEEMARGGYMKPCLEETEWASPILLVKKKDGSWHFCIDYRKLNSVTRKSSHPLPRIEDTIDGLAGFNFFHSLDIKSAYYQVVLAPEDELKNRVCCTRLCPPLLHSDALWPLRSSVDIPSPHGQDPNRRKRRKVGKGRNLFCVLGRPLNPLC